MGNIVDTLVRHAAATPDKTLYAFYDSRGRETEAYSFKAFHGRSGFVARAIAENFGIAPGDRAVLAYAPGLDFVVAFFACLKLGAIPVPAPSPGFGSGDADIMRLAHIARDCDASVILCDGATQRHFAALGEIDTGTDGAVAWLANLTWFDTGSFVGTCLEETGAQASEVMFLQYTSGSTRDPKGVVIGHANVEHNCRLLIDHGDPVGVSWLPQFHDMGLIGFYLFAILTGGTTHGFAPLDFLRRPRLWFDLIHRTRATITSAPDFGYAYCLDETRISDGDIDDWDLASLRIMMNGAEPVRASTLAGFRERFSRAGLGANTLVAGYGLAEHTLGATFGGASTRTFRRDAMAARRLESVRVNGKPVAVSTLASCGATGRDTVLAIVDPETLVQVEDGIIGEIWLSGPSVAQGYWQRPLETERTFEARLPNMHARFLRTGDMGAVVDGELYVCGRAKDMLIVRGQNLYPSDIEHAVADELNDAGVPGVVAFAASDTTGGEGDDRVIVLVERSQRDVAIDAPAVAAKVAASFALRSLEIAVVPAGAIARTSSGKVRRGACADAWSEGSVTMLAHGLFGPRDAGRCNGIDDVLWRLRSDALAGSGPIEGLGIDSVDLVSLSLYLEEGFSTAGALSDGVKELCGDLRVLQSLSVADMRVLADLAGKPSKARTSSDLQSAATIAERALERVRRGDDREMRDDADLADDLSFTRSSFAGPDGAVLITGATGFLGVHLTVALLRQTDRNLIALVRGEDAIHGALRLTEAMRQARLWSADLAERYRARVRVIAGDVARSRLGLSDADWTALSLETHAIYHCAADVDYVRTYRGMRPANVIGTRHVLELAAAGRAKTLHHVSTTFVFGWSIFGALRESASNTAMKALDFGYAQTKWVSERLVFHAVAQGLDARIYRPSLVTASADGHYLRDDIVARALGYMIRNGVAVDTPNQVSFLPVDHVAQNLAVIATGDGAPGTTYHLTARAHYSLPDVTRTITQLFGYRFEYLDIPGFITHANTHCGAEDDLYPLLPFLSRNGDKLHRMRNKRYDNANYLAALDRNAAAQDEPALDDVVNWIVRFLRDKALIPEAPRIGRFAERAHASPAQDPLA